MKSILVFATLVFVGLQAQAINMAGCGLGHIAMGDDGAPILVATTNGTVSNQLFGITSGTLNCEPTGKKTMAEKTEVFLDANGVRVADDIARGNGETVAALSKILGCDSPANVKAALKQNFNAIFPNASVSSKEMTTEILSTIKNDARTASSCELV